MSTQTWSSKLGLDYAHEQQNIAEHTAAAPAPTTDAPPAGDGRTAAHLQPPQPDRG